MIILKNIRVKNFKLFSNENFELSPITILTGPNSSGKSSLLKALVAILQTSTNPPFPFQLKTNGESMSLGTFSDIVRSGAKPRTFGIGIELAHTDGIDSFFGEYRYAARGREVLVQNLDITVDGMKFELKWDGQKRGYSARVSGDKVTMDDPERVKVFVEAMNRMMEEEQPKGSTPSDLDKLLNAVEKIQHNWGKRLHIGNLGIHELTQFISSNMSAVLMVSAAQTLSSLGQRINYVAAVRAYPQRFYGAGDLGDRIDTKGRNSIAILHEWKRRFPTKFERVVSAIAEIGVASSVAADQIEDDILKLTVDPFGKRLAPNIADVGFGVSQILPVLISDEALGSIGVLAANQPEVHLHPKAQAAFGDYMATRLQNRQYLIETHSEYIINRLRKLVVQERIKPEDVKIYHFEPSLRTKNVKIHRININEDGELVGAPKHYFDTYARDSFEIAMAK